MHASYKLKVYVDGGRIEEAGIGVGFCCFVLFF